jgi:hypothetical protein
MSNREETTDAVQERERRQEALDDALRAIVDTFGIDPRLIGRWRGAPLPGSHLSPTQIADDGKYLSALLARLQAIVAMAKPGSPPADHLMGLPFVDLQARRREELCLHTLATEETTRLQSAHPAAEVHQAAVDAANEEPKRNPAELRAGRERQSSSRFIDDIEDRARTAFGDVAGKAWLERTVWAVRQASVDDVRSTLTSADRAKIEAALTRDRPDRMQSADYSTDVRMLARLRHALTQRAHVKICDSQMAQLWLGTTQPALGYRRPIEYCTSIRALDECLELLEMVAERRLLSREQE